MKIIIVAEKWKDLRFALTSLNTIIIIYIYIILAVLLSVMVREFLKTSGVNLIQFCLYEVTLRLQRMARPYM